MAQTPMSVVYMDPEGHHGGNVPFLTSETTGIDLLATGDVAQRLRAQSREPPRRLRGAS